MLDEGFDRFVDEERIAARPSVQSFGELPGSGRVGAKLALEQLDDGVNGERRESEALSVS